MRTGNLTLMAGASISNLRAQSLASDPTVGSLLANQEAWIWYNSTDKVYKYFNGTAIVSLSGGGTPPDLSGYLKADGTVALTDDLELSSADQSASDNTAATSKGYVTGLLDNKLSVNAGALTADLSAGNFKVSNLGAPSVGTDAARKIDIDNALAGMNWKEDVDGLQVDGTLQPQKVEGKRYILTDTATLHADFGTIAGVVDDVIVQYEGSAFVIVFTPTEDRAEGAIAWNSDTNQYVRFDGTAWANFGGMSSVTAGDGLLLTGNVLSVVTDAAGGVETSAGAVRVKLDGASLARSATGLKVADGGVGYAQIAAAALGTGLKQNATTSKIELDTTAVKAAGFIDADGGTVATLVLSDEMLDLDNAVPTRKYVDDAIAAGGSAGGLKLYVLDKTGAGDTAETSYTFEHFAGTRFGTVSVFDVDGKQIQPSEVTLIDENSLSVTLPEALKVSIAFVTGTVTTPVVPPVPETYQLLISENTGSNSARYLIVVPPSGTTDLASVAITNADGTFTGLSNTRGTMRQVTATLTAGTTYSYKAVITKTDTTTETVTLDYVAAAPRSPFVIQMGGKNNATQTNTSMSAVSYDDLAIHAASKTIGLGFYTATLPAGRTITSVDWKVFPVTARVANVDYSKMSMQTGPTQERANLVTTFSDTEITALGSTYFATVIAKITLDDASVHYQEAFITARNAAPTTYFWSDAQLGL